MIVGHGKAALSLDPVETRAKSDDGGFGGCIFHLGQGDEQRGALDQGANGGSVTGTFDEISLPVAGNKAFLDLDGPVMNARHVGDGSATIRAASTRTSRLARLAQAGDQLAAEFAAWHGVDGRVERLVTDLEPRAVGMHTCQYAGNLLRRVALAQQVLNDGPQRSVYRQARRAARRCREPARPRPSAAAAR